MAGQAVLAGESVPAFRLRRQKHRDGYGGERDAEDATDRRHKVFAQFSHPKILKSTRCMSRAALSLDDGGADENPGTPTRLASDRMPGKLA
jgi:hypothetical protein